jgi:hypothetical protein
MNNMTQRRFFSALLFLSTLTLGVFSQASQVLSIGSAPIFLPGTTVATEADLGGAVLVDNVIPFRIVNAGSQVLFVGKLQNRVVKSSTTGNLHFYYRIRETQSGLNGIIKSVGSLSFQTSPRLLVDWRPDGLGQVNPIEAQRSTVNGALIQFNFDIADQVLVGGLESKFFYVKTFSKNYSMNGQTKIQLTSGESVILNTAAPVK